VNNFLYTDEQIKDKFFFSVSNDRRHDLYDANVAIAKHWRSIITGADQKDILLRYRRYRTKSSKKQLEQRHKVTVSKTRSVSHKIRTTYKEVDRCDDLSDTYLIDEKEDHADLKKIKDGVSKFSGSKSVDQYLDTVYMDKNMMDPNAFLLVSYSDYDARKETANCFPMIIESKATRDYEYNQGDLQFFMFDTAETKMLQVDKKRKRIVVKTHWCFTPNSLFKLEEVYEGQVVGEDTEIITLDTYEDFEVYYVEGDDNKIKKTTIETGASSVNKRGYIFTAVDTKTKDCVPARQFGHFLNVETDQRNYESLLWPCKDAFTELIDKKSAYDMHLALHGFAQKFVYVAPCNYVKEGTTIKCNGGTIGAMKTDCPKCKGSGKMPIHRSEGDIITLELPLRNDAVNEEVIDLSKLVHYAEIPQHIIELHGETVEKVAKEIPEILFNNYTALKSEVQAATATEINQNKTPVNNALFEYASGKAAMFEFIVKMIATYKDIENRFSIVRKYPSDFRLDSASDLLSQRKKALDCSAPIEVIQKIDNRIILKQNMDNDEFVDRIRIKQMFRPFTDRNELEKMNSLALLPASDPKKQLYLRIDDIFKIIDYDPKHSGFYKKKYIEQKAIVDELLKTLIPEKPETVLPVAVTDLNFDDDDEDDD